MVCLLRNTGIIMTWVQHLGQTTMGLLRLTNRRYKVRRVVSGSITRWYLLMSAALMAVLLLTMSGGGFAQAAETIEVTNNNDSGDGSLRDAIGNAAAGDTITFADNVTGTILLESELVINEDLTIEGPEIDDLALYGHGVTRILRINSGTVDISGLTIKNGNAPGD